MSIWRFTSALLSAALLAGPAAPIVSAQQGPGESFALSLDQALRVALENNLDLVSARYGPDFAEQDIQLQLSNYDAGFQASGTRSDQEQAAQQLSTVTGSELSRMDVGVQKNLRMGADFTVGFATSQTNQTGPNVVAPTAYVSGFTFDFNLPILKGFGTEVTTEQLVLAGNDYQISVRDLEARAENVLETVEGAYWDVIAAAEALRVARESLERAHDLLELNRKKVEVGTLAPIEITQAEAGVASEEEGVIIAEESLLNAEDELRRLLAIPHGDPRWGQSIIATDRPDFSPRVIDLEQAIDTAMANRPELFTAEQKVKNRVLSEHVAKRQTRHQLDLNANYNPSGASLDTPTIFDFGPDGIPNTGDDILIPANVADLNESVSRSFQRDQFTWSATLLYRVPIGNRAAKASYTTARLAREQSEVDLLNTAQTVRVEVRRAVRAVDSGFRRLDAALANVVLQRKKLEAEQKRYDNGMSTTFEVRQFQNDLSESELSQIRAGLNYARSLATLERVKGTLLEFHRLSISK